MFRDPINVNRRFVPLLLSDCDIPDAVRQFKYIDFRDETEPAFDELVASLRTEKSKERTLRAGVEDPAVWQRRFPELRADLTRNVASRLAPPNPLRLLFVSGESGIGKSHFCDQVSLLLVQEHAAKIYSLNAVADARPFLRRVAASVLGESIYEETANLTRKLLGESNLHNLYSIHVANCHNLSVQDVQGLAFLIAELESEGWGKVQFLLEYESRSSQSYWTEFVRNIRRNIPDSDELVIHPPNPQEIATAIKEMFLTFQPERIAAAMIAKAGVNPLLVVNTLQNMITRGACRWMKSGDRNVLVVDDFQLFENQLSEIPHKIKSLLRERIEQYNSLGNEGESREWPFGERLALHAVVGPEFDLSWVADALEITLPELHNIDIKLVHDGFFKHPGLGVQVDFVHEMMRLAAEEYGRDSVAFLGVADRLVRRLDTGTARDAILAGTLYQLLKRSEDALVCFRAAFELSRQVSDYPLQRAALVGCREVSKFRLPETLEQKKEWIDWHVHLGWIEMQAGSQTQAIAEFDRARKAAVDMLANHGLLEKKLLGWYDVHIMQRKLTCLLNQQRIRESVELLQSIIPKVKNTQQLFDVVNRFVLLCFMTGQPGPGIIAARLGWRLANMLNSESRSVIMSDIGHLLLLEHPEKAKIYWQECLRSAQEVRQRTHAETNMLIASVYAGHVSAEHNFEHLLQTVQAQTGTSIQLARLYMYAGTRAVAAQDWDQAGVYFEHARLNAATFSHVSYEWEANNNLGVLCLVRDDAESAGQYFAMAISRVHALITECDSERLTHLAHFLESRTGELHKKLVQVEDIEFDTPSSTGLIWYLLFNLRQLSKAAIHVLHQEDFWLTVDQRAMESSISLIARDANPLLVRTNYGDFTLALE